MHIAESNSKMEDENIPFMYIVCLLQENLKLCICGSDLCNSGRQEVSSLTSLLLVVAVSLTYNHLYRTKM